jgi:hypothetical protein
MAEIEARRSYENPGLGAKTLGAFAAWKLPIPAADARAMARCCRQLRSMPLVSEAFNAGSISVAHVRLFAKCEATNPTAFAEAEDLLVSVAMTQDFHSFSIAARYWCNLADPDGSLDDAERKYLARKAHAARAADGMVLVKAQLDPVAGTLFLECFRRIKKELFLLDWEAAKPSTAAT